MKNSTISKIAKYRHLLSMLTIFFLFCICFGWIGYHDVTIAKTSTEREIVNDDYSRISVEIADEIGLSQNIKVKAFNSLYGVNLNVHTFDRIQHGTVTVRLLKDGQTVATAAEDMQFLLDNTFKKFQFDNVVESEKDESYVLNISVVPEEKGVDKIALWYGEEVKDGFELLDCDGNPVGTLALQYITDYVGGSIYKYYAVMSLLCLLAVEGAYYLAFVKKAPVHIWVLTVGFFVGTLFCVFTPIGGGPDEIFHIAESYKISNKILGIENEMEKPAEYLRLRLCDAMEMEKGVRAGEFSFKNIATGLSQKEDGRGQMVSFQVNTASSRQTIQHIMPAIGVTIARLLHLGFVPLVVLGRFFNMLFYLGCAVLAVKTIPVYKLTLALCSILPMTMQTVGSMSYDMPVLAMSALFVAAVFKLTYGEKVKKSDYLLLSLSYLLLSPIKQVYSVMGIALLIIPAQRLGGRKKALISKFALIAFAVALSLMPRLTGRATVGVNTQNVPEYTGVTELSYPFELSQAEEEYIPFDPLGELLPNGDSKYNFTPSYILHNLKPSIKIFANTVTHQSTQLVQTTIGTRLGEIILTDLQASNLFLFAILIILYMSAVPVENSWDGHTITAKALCILTFLVVLAVVIGGCFIWTPTNYDVLFGLQGRYLLPALPLLLASVHGKNLVLKKDITPALFCAFTATEILIILNVFSIMIGG